KGSRRVNGKSIMGVMMLAAARGTVIVVETDGADEDEALEAIVRLIESGPVAKVFTEENLRRTYHAPANPVGADGTTSTPRSGTELAPVKAMLR
ncbi:MAG: HPr family phosphocarrier protein, partial [Thermomicrobiales bacterium]